MRLIRLPGEPAMAAPRVQSFMVLGDVLWATDLADTALSIGEKPGTLRFELLLTLVLSLSEGMSVALISGVLMRGVEVVEAVEAGLGGGAPLLRLLSLALLSLE